MNIICGIKKSTLGEWNDGHTSANANCYYKGNSICWVIFTEDLETGKKEDVIAVKRKVDAELMAGYLTEIGYHGVGDPMAMFLKHCAEYGDWETIDKIKEV